MMRHSAVGPLAVILYALVVPLAPQPATARTLGTALTGNELLLQLDKIGPGESSPGVYAADDEGNLRRVVTFGKYPCWALSHSRFACEVDDETWVVHVKGMEAGVVNRIGGFLGGDRLLGFIVPRAMTWTPEEDALVRWRLMASESRYRRAPVTLALSEKLPQGVQPSALCRDRDIGAVSFSADGKHVACEAYRAVPGVVALDSQVFVYERMTGAVVQLQKDAFVGSLASANPGWSPQGDRLAMDCVGQDNVRRAIIYDMATGQAAPVPPHPQYKDYTNWTQFLSWSPRGDYLLVASEPSGGLAGTWVLLVSARQGEPLRVVSVLGGSGFVYGAVWSPQGDRIAVLEGNQRDVDCCAVSTIGIYDLRQRVRGVSVPSYLRAVGLTW